MKANKLALRNLQDNHSAIWDIIIGGAFAVIFIVVALYIGTFVASTVGSGILAANGVAGTYAGNSFKGRTFNTTMNISRYWDTDVGMLNIALVITVMTIPLMALVYIRKVM